MPYSLFKSIIRSIAPFKTKEPGVSPGWTLQVKTTTFFYLSNLKGLFDGFYIASGYRPVTSSFGPSGRGIVSLSHSIKSRDDIVIISIFLPSIE